ncbi:MAG: tRNA (cytidine(56)-2'-O)-methyltransferase [Candidatus Micrarchaeota archaeon]|nr:tRNA (cytidine(56)-2'-O)-methyltransferase [Candidatus Micrarchaeota archaeon]
MITVLSIGEGDYRVRLNMCLTARAFGAAKIVFIGRRDGRISKYIARLNSKWGGMFKVDFSSNAGNTIRSFSKYKKIYLTMFGTPLKQVEYMLKTYKNILLIVTARDWEGQLAKLTDFNVSITNQPHAQVASIAIFLHEFFNGRELAIQFQNAKYKAIPKPKGAQIRKLG